MRFLWSFLFTLTVLHFSQAQTVLKKADKQYELFAYNLAIQSYLEAFKNNDVTAESQARLADCYRHLNQMTEAAQWYEKALVSSEVNSRHFLDYGKTLMAIGEYDKARQWFEKYKATDPITGTNYSEICGYALLRSGDPAIFKVKNVPTNSSSSDFAPALFKGQLVYASARNDIKKSTASSGWTGDAQNRLFKAAMKKEGSFSTPELLHADLRGAFNEGPLSFSPQGDMVAFSRNNFVDGTRQVPSAGLQMSIFLAETDDKGDWSLSRPFPFNGVNYSTGYPAFSPDGKALYFASDRPDGFGGFDIYVCYRFGNNWTAPENLGPTVNTRGNEISPFFDGTKLFFASEWHQGFGGFDIFQSEKSGDLWLQPVHLGSGVNSSYDDYGFIFNENDNVGFFTSNRPGGKGNEDIYSVSKETGAIMFTVRNASNGEALEGITVEMNDCKLEKGFTDKNGKLSRQVTGAIDCEAVVKKEGYQAESVPVKTNFNNAILHYPLLLKKESELYSGKVIEPTTNLGIDAVIVEVINQKNGYTTREKTDASGHYTLALSPHSGYTIRYTKAGFVDLNRSLKTGDGTRKEMLEPVLLVPTGLGRDSRVAYAEPKPASNSPVVLTARGASAEATGNEMLIAKDQKNNERVKGFAVQIASVSGEVNLPDYYESLVDLGNVYLVREKDFNKVRLGVYRTKEEAGAAQEIIKEKGYGEAFIIPDEGILFSSPVMLKVKKENVYKIRLAAYSDLRWFDESKVADLGSIEKQTSGEFTIIFAGEFKGLEDAKKALQSKIEAGFKDAYLVEKKDGAFVKVE